MNASSALLPATGSVANVTISAVPTSEVTAATPRASWSDVPHTGSPTIDRPTTSTRAPFHLGRRRMSIRTLRGYRLSEDWRAGFKQKFIYWSEESKHHPEFGEYSEQVGNRMELSTRLASFGVLGTVVLLILGVYLHDVRVRMITRRCKCVRCRQLRLQAQLEEQREAEEQATALGNQQSMSALRGIHDMMTGTSAALPEMNKQSAMRSFADQDRRKSKKDIKNMLSKFTL